MKRLFELILMMVAFAIGADVKPLVYENIAKDSAAQQEQYDYMLQYKLYGRDYLKIGIRVRIPDKSGWNGSSGPITSKEQLVLGGPILTDSSIVLGNEAQITTGPVRADSLYTGNDNGNAIFNGNYCLNKSLGNLNETQKGFDRGNGKLSCDSVPNAPTGMSMPTIVFPDTTNINIVVNDREKKFIDIPDVPSYDLYVNSIKTGTEDTLYFRLANRGTLTRVFVKDEIVLGNHTVLQTYYGDSAVTQDKYRGNLLFYTQKDFNLINSDNGQGALQGTFISTSKIYFKSNIQFAGQLIANQLELGDDFDGKNFHFVKFDPDTIDVKLDKYGGLRENDSLVTIPIELSDTASVAVFFTYCFDLKDGVTLEDFTQPPELPTCDKKSVEVAIPRGSKVPDVPIQVIVKVDTMTEPNEYLVMRIDSINGAILPNGETSGELKIKIIDSTFNNNLPIEILTAQTDSISEFADIGTPCGLVEAKDENDTVTYDIINTNEFNINPSTGVITSNTLLDYETQKEYLLTVRITSTDGSTKDTNLTIYVKNENEPVHINDETFTVPENVKDTIIGKVEGKDDDREPVKYSLRDSNDYHIDSISGNITIKTPLDYEKKKTDTLIVYATTDNGDKDSAIVIINVVNVNGSPVLQPNDTLNVPENCKNCEVGKVVAIDPDKDPITYTIKEPVFTIDTNGIIKVTNPLDYEKTPVVTITVIAKDTSGASDTSTYKIKVTDVNEPVHTKDTTCSIKENYIGNVCKIVGTDEDKTKPTFIITDTTNYKIDSTGQIVIIKHIDYEKKTNDTIKVIVTDGTFYDTSTVIIKVINEDEIPKITTIDDKPPVDTIKTNDPYHKIEYKICENTKCEYDSISTHIIKDTTIKVCNTNKTICDSVVFLFNDVPPLVILTNVKSTDAYIDYITIEEEIKDDKIYVNKKDNKIIVTVKDTVHKKETKFDIDVKLDTIPTKDIKIKEYNYLIDESNATYKAIGNNLVEVSEVIKTEDGNKIVVTKVIDNNGKDVDTVQTITYTKKVNGKEVVVTYKIDNLSGQRIGVYDVSYMIDSCTKVTYKVNDKNQIVKNKEGNIGYTITYDYTDEYGNKATSSIDIVYDDIAPNVEIISPTKSEHFNTNAINVMWTINGEIQNTLNIQRLEKGVNWVIRRYVDKAGNVSADTVMVFMNEAKDIDITIINPVTEINQDKVDEYYSSGNKYDTNKPYKVTTVDPKDNKLPETIGVGFIVNIALPSINATGNVSTLYDIIKNDKVPVDDKGNVVGASNISIPVEEYINENCTDDFRQDYHKNGTNIPLYNVKYNLHLWMYTSNANYVNDFEINYDIDSKTEANAASIAKFVIDWIPEKDGNVKAKNQKSLGTGAYLVKLYSKSTAIYRCGFKKQKAGDKIIKKEYNLKSFGYKRPNK